MENCFLFVICNVTPICCIFLASCTYLTALQHDLFTIYVSKVMSRRLHYVVGFTLLGSLHPLVTNAHSEHRQLPNITT